MMVTIDDDMRRIFASTVQIERMKIGNYRSVRLDMFDKFTIDKRDIPLVFFAKRVLNELTNLDLKYYEVYTEVNVQIISNYICIHLKMFGTEDVILVIKRENDCLYSLRGFLRENYKCFAPKDIDREAFKDFIYELQIPMYMTDIRFSYPLYVEPILKEDKVCPF